MNNAEKQHIYQPNFSHWLNQFNNKSKKKIPDALFIKIHQELKQRNIPQEKITQSIIKEILLSIKPDFSEIDRSISEMADKIVTHR